MKNRRNYYRVLHVGRDAPAAVITACYRTLLQRLKMHPDLGGDNAEAAIVNDAYATLSDPDRRAAYDRTLVSASEQRREAEAPAWPREEAPASSRPATAATRSATRCSFCSAPFPANDAKSPASACAGCESVLFPAPKHQVGGASRRAFERLPRNMPVTFRLARSRNVARTGALVDLSLNGMRLLSQVNIPIGERVRIDCAFCSAVAIVRSRSPKEHGQGGWQCGMEFLTPCFTDGRGGLISILA
jgi:curved DNA-binding protein CbpA